MRGIAARVCRKAAAGRRLGILAAAAICVAAGAEERTDSNLPYKEIAVSFAQKMPELHLEAVALDDEMARNALSLYLDTLDGDRSLFLQSDIVAFESERDTLDDRLRKGDVTFAFRVADILVRRAENRCAFVETLLTNGVMNLETDEEYVWKRKDAPWPADAREWDELWRKKIADQMIRRRIAAAMRAGSAKTEADKEPSEDGEAAAETDEEFIRKQYRQFLTVLRDNDRDWVFQQYLSSFARAYDPHSDYMSPATADDFDISMRLSLVGIGALLTSEDGAAKVVRIIPGGAADRDGRLKAGDKIVAVGEGRGEPVDVMHWPLNKVVQRIRGEKGKKVTLVTIPASDAKATVRIELARDEVRLEDQEAKGETTDISLGDGQTAKVGVIVLPGFYADLKARSGGSGEYKSSVRDVKGILAGMRGNGIEGLVLDLRNNGGGALAEAVEMTGLFISSGPVVQVKERSAVSVLYDEDASTAYAGPLVILTDRMSASASEILAAALQDYGRAVIVGDSRTHGKGTVQSVVPLSAVGPDLGTLRVTTATFFRITGKSTQVHGVAADVVAASPFDALDVGESFLEHALPWTHIGPVDMKKRPRSGFFDELFLWRGFKPADYQPIASIEPLIEALNERAAVRRRADPRYAAREELIGRLKEKQRETTIPLNLTERLKAAREDEQLGKMLSEAEPDGTGGKKPGEDMVKEEALRVLGDMLRIRREEAAAGE